MKLAAISARGGSKRVPRENIRRLHGRPIIGWSIAAAQDSGCFDRVVVSTDDAEIAEVARDFGAEVPFVRPPELSDDHAATVPVIAHATEWHRREGGSVGCIYATAPFVSAEDLRQGLDTLDGTSADYVFSATRTDGPAHERWLGSDWRTDAQQTLAIAGRERLEWCVVDPYGAEPRWEPVVRSTCDRMLVIDDLADRPHACDVRLDQNLGRDRDSYLPRPLRDEINEHLFEAEVALMDFAVENFGCVRPQEQSRDVEPAYGRRRTRADSRPAGLHCLAVRPDPGLRSGPLPRLLRPPWPSVQTRTGESQE